MAENLATSMTRAQWRDDPRCYNAARYNRPDLGLHPAVTFTLDPGGGVVVLGNCFAHQVEDRLVERGVPAAGRCLGALYALGSLSQSVRWALHGGFEERFLVRLDSGACFNPHRAPYTPYPDPAAAMQEMTAGLEAAGDAIRCADAAVLVLSVTEFFRDEDTGLAMTHVPEPAFEVWRRGRARPRRSTHGDIVRGVMELVMLLRAARPALKILLGVSPVNQDYTLFGTDVFLANGYTRGTLRSAADESILRLRGQGVTGVDYFPCWELAMLNPREQVFKTEHLGKPYGRFVRGRFVRDVIVETLLRCWGAAPAEERATLPESSAIRESAVAP